MNTLSIGTLAGERDSNNAFFCFVFAGSFPSRQLLRLSLSLSYSLHIILFFLVYRVALSLSEHFVLELQNKSKEAKPRNRVFNGVTSLIFVNGCDHGAVHFLHFKTDGVCVCVYVPVSKYSTHVQEPKVLCAC